MKLHLCSELLYVARLRHLPTKAFYLHGGQNFLDYCGTLVTNGTRRLTGGKYLWVALYDWYGRAKVECGFVKSSDGLIC